MKKGSHPRIRRPARGDSTVEVTINDQLLPVEGIVALTLHNGEPSESWLHCWFCLKLLRPLNH
jgi:hypothetical protein